MEINRKRGARRLASSLLAGALVFGGLAISGASPASAANPTWAVSDRIGGVDRYETAVLVAEDLDPDTLLVASGVNPADALAGSAIVRSENAAIILTAPDALPEVVNEYLESQADDGFDGDVYVLGGEAAVSESVFDAIADILADSDVERVAGDDRYETAAEINSMLGVPDGAIIVNGADGRWPDALSVGQVAATLEWPIIVTGDGGLNETATDQIDELLLDNDEAEFLLIGGTAVMPDSVEQYLRDEGVAQGSIRRLGGADRYGTNVMVNAYMLEGGTDAAVTTAQAVYGDLYAFGDGDDAGYGITLVSGETPWDALSANAWTTSGSPWHLVLVRPTSVPPLTGVALGLLGQLGGPQGVGIIGGRSAVADSVRTAVFAAVNTDADAPTVAGCVEGSPTLGLTFTGLDGETKDGNDDVNLEIAIDFDGNEDLYVGEDIDDYSTDNIEAEGQIVAISTVSDLGLYADRSNWSITFYEGIDDDATDGTDTWVPYGLQEDDEVTVDTQNNPIYQLVGSGECVVAEDDTAPTVTIDAIEDTGVFVTANEPIAFNFAGFSVVDGSGTAWPGTTVIDGPGGVADLPDLLGDSSPTSTASLSALGIGHFYSTGWLIPVSDLDENERIKFNAGSFIDQAGNETEVASQDRVSVDETEPTLTKVVSVCENTASPSWIIPTDAGGILLQQVGLLAAASAPSGPAGNDWTVEIVDDRGGDTVTVEADNEDEVLTITGDVGRSTAADIYRAFLDAGLGGLLGSWALFADWDGILADDGEVDLFGSGLRDCTVVVSGGEPTRIVWSDSDLPDVGSDYFEGEGEGLFLDTQIIVITELEDASSEVEINFDTLPEDAAGNEADDRFTFTI